MFQKKDAVPMIQTWMILGGLTLLIGGIEGSLNIFPWSWELFYIVAGILWLGGIAGMWALVNFLGEA